MTEGSHGPIHDQILARGKEQRSDRPTLVFTTRTCLEWALSQGLQDIQKGRPRRSSEEKSLWRIANSV